MSTDRESGTGPGQCERHGVDVIVEPGGVDQPSIRGRTYCPLCQIELMAALDLTEDREVVVDDRGRVSLRGLVDKHAIYVARAFRDGSVILEPAKLRQEAS